MRSKLIIFSLCGSAFLLAVLHDFSLRLNWNYHYPHVDIPLHILAGFVVSLTAHIAALVIRKKTTLINDNSQGTVWVMFLATFLVAILWEFVELVFFLTKDAGLSLETLSDVFFTVLGAALATSFIHFLLPVGEEATELADF